MSSKAFQLVEKLVFRQAVAVEKGSGMAASPKGEVLSISEAEGFNLRPKAYKGTSMGEKTSNKRKYYFQSSVFWLPLEGAVGHSETEGVLKGGYRDL